MNRTAKCRCGQLSAMCTGEPIRISVCHCLACQLRTGSAFAAQARFLDEMVEIAGTAKSWQRTSDIGVVGTYWFCENCGSTVYYKAGPFPGMTAVPIGAFADPDFPAPSASIYEERKHRWVAIIGDDIDHHD
jgi:hypothetical protein